MTTCSIIYAITVSGGSGNSLITLSGGTVRFSATNILANAGTYTISVTAKISGQTTWSAATMATFTYINPCLTATVVSTCPSNFQVEVSATNSASVPLWSDSVTTAVNNGTTICPLSYKSILVTSAPSLTANTTMHTKFGWA